MRSVPVWDFPTRIFHWSLVAAVVTSYVTGGEDGLWFVVHTISGYVIALLLVFRLIWGFVGGVHSRFSDFVYSRGTVADYTRQLLRFRPPRFVGHNPLGGWMIVLILVALTGTVATGLFSGENHGPGGILLPLIAAPGSKGLGEVHEFFGNFIVFLAAIHVLGVAVDWVLTRENLVMAMITGRKWVDEGDVDVQRPETAGWRGAIVAVIVAALGAVLFQQTDFGALAAADGHAGSPHESGHEYENHEANDD